MIPTGSNPLFSQNVRSSMAVVASARIGGTSANETTRRLNSPKRASSTVPVRSYTTDCSGSSMRSRTLGSGRSAAREV